MTKKKSWIVFFGNKMTFPEETGALVRGNAFHVTRIRREKLKSGRGTDRKCWISVTRRIHGWRRFRVLFSHWRFFPWPGRKQKQNRYLDCTIISRKKDAFPTFSVPPSAFKPGQAMSPTADPTLVILTADKPDAAHVGSSLSPKSERHNAWRQPRGAIANLESTRLP